jgi:uncharacterized protein DUF6678
MHKSLRAIIDKQDLVSVMNNTKWKELAFSIESDSEKEQRQQVWLYACYQVIS